jgi:hypothetical protein
MAPEEGSMTLLAPLGLALLLGASPITSLDFERHWKDGQAELDGYRLVQPRYGSERAGEAVMVWVLEPFSRSKAVKLDDWANAGADRVQVMKLNHHRRFQTGIYDYTLLTSVFSPTAATGGQVLAPIKVAFTSQEWCGTVFHQLVRRGGGYESTWHSYFESEGDGRAQLPLAPNALLEDELWFRLRELTRPLLPGNYPLVPSLMAVRLSHAPLVPGTIAVRRTAEAAPLTVPAGRFEVTRWELELRWGPGGERVQRRKVWVERDWPRRIIAWEGEVAGFSGNEPSTERGELTGSMRDAYWKHNRPGDEALREKLGLVPNGLGPAR